MGPWRTQAKGYLPAYGKVIDESENLWQLWFRLRDDVLIEYQRTSDSKLIADVFAFAKWCVWGQNDLNISTCACLGFLEELPDNPRAKEDLPRRLTLNEFHDLEDVYRYWLKEEYDDFRRWFESAWRCDVSG